MVTGWIRLPTKGQNASVYFNANDYAWIKAQGADFIRSKIAQDKCLGTNIGEISIYTFNNLPGLLNPDEQDDILTAITQETGVDNWGAEGKIRVVIELDVLSNARLKEIKTMCLNWSQPLERILKGIILKDKGYVVYDSVIPKRNRLAVVTIRELLRNQRELLQNDPFHESILLCAINKLTGNSHDW